jgi:long-chain acyl-CoA synthetase
MNPNGLLDETSGSLTELVRTLAVSQPEADSLICEDHRLSYGELDRLVDRAAATLRREGLGPGEAMAICAGTSIENVAMFLGAVRAGAVAALLPVWASAPALLRMLEDSDSRLLFFDASAPSAFVEAAARRLPSISLEPEGLGSWLRDAGAQPDAGLPPEAPCNIIYSSGTTGTPKGVVQSRAMRWIHAQQGRILEPPARMLISTPLHSTGGSTSLLMTLGAGGAAVLMPRFEPRAFLELAQRRRVTHAVLTPVQYRRIMDQPDFERFDLSSFRMTFSIAAPSPPALKAEILRRWPGGLTEIYGATEGGACILRADLRPDKLRTVGRPGPATELKIIDDEGRELPTGEAGEIVAHSRAIMTGYHNRPDATAEAEWRDAAGRRFFRTGDIGRLDEEGFLTLLGRRKDMIISGGAKIHPVDLEQALLAHGDVEDAAVVAAPSERWGETPAAFVVPRPGSAADPEAIRTWANERLGRTQRLSQVRLIDALPRNDLGKVLKRELREQLADAPSRRS